MKRNFKSFVQIIASALVIYACKGPEGPVGPAGTAGSKGDAGAVGAAGAAGIAGAAGAAGVAGAAGKDGNANVVYSDWKGIKSDKINFQNKDASGNYTDLYFEPSDKTEPLLTKDAINKAAIFTYSKANERSWNVEKQKYELLEKFRLLDQNGIYNYYKIEGRTEGNFSTYIFNAVYNIDYAENFFNYSIYNNLSEGDGKGGTKLIAEFAGKDAAFFRDKLSNIQIRHVIIYGSTKGKLASIDMKNYAEVKKALNLPN